MCAALTAADTGAPDCPFMQDEVEFVSSFGYAVYLASAEEAEMNQQFQRVYTVRPSTIGGLGRAHQMAAQTSFLVAPFSMDYKPGAAL